MSEQEQRPSLMIHGGAGSKIRDDERAAAVESALAEVRDDLYAMLREGASAQEVVVEGCRRMESNPNFNAGTGSVLQSDGQIRMSAALMDGAARAFSGVINAQKVEHPIDLAAHLQGERDRVLADDGVTTLLRELDVPYYDPMTEKRMKEWVRQRRRDFDADMAQVVSGAGDEPGHGTIGVVARDTRGRLSAGTSTGGRGFEHVGRVSDSAMPAGNYANEHAAVSCTGIGEDIIDDCAAARLVIRATDGVPLREAFERTFEEADEADHSYAAIAVGADGEIAWGKTTDTLLAAWHDGRRRDQTLNLAAGRIVESRAG